MSDPTSIFNNQNPPAPQDQNNGGNSNPPTPSSNDQLAHLLTGIKNERGEQKYKTVEDALNALKHSQDYIPQLSDKLRQQEQELIAAKAAADKITELENTLKALTQQSQTPPSTPTPQGMSEEQVAALVSKTLTQAQQAEVAKNNLSKVVNTVKQAFGDKAEEVFYGKAQELGMSMEEINSLAARTPTAALKLLGVEGSTPTPQPNNAGSINTSAFQPTPDSLISRNSKPTLVGATTADLNAESANAKRMVEELHSQGKSVHDLTDPKVYFKYFK
jgi:DNA repair exonuclease SbcCD ATPase subunit